VQQLLYSDRVGYGDATIAAAIPPSEVMEVPVDTRPINEQLYQLSSVPHEDAMHQPSSMRSYHNVRAQIDTYLLFKGQLVEVYILDDDAIDMLEVDRRFLELLQRLYDLSVIADHPTEAPWTELIPQMTEKERMVGITVLLLRPFLRHPSRHVGDDHCPAGLTACIVCLGM